MGGEMKEMKIQKGEPYQVINNLPRRYHFVFSRWKGGGRRGRKYKKVGGAKGRKRKKGKKAYQVYKIIRRQ
jgi:hypothetical protein